MRFRQLKQEVSIEDVLLHYGWDGRDFGGTNWVSILCPFHWDEDPSAGIKGRQFKCWACGISGDIIDVVAQVEGMTLGEAGRWIDANCRDS